MVGSIGKVITSLFGKKSDKDVKFILPLVKETLAEQEKIKNISNDALRNNSDIFRKEIKDFIKPEEDKVKQLKIDAEKVGLPVLEKEAIFKAVSYTHLTLPTKRIV